MALTLLVLGLAGCGTRNAVTVEDAWIRPVEAGHGTAGYLTLVNDSADTLALIGVTAPAVQSAQMHQTVRENGVLSMRGVDRFDVPPHQRLFFKPGGNHLMLMDAVITLAEGDTTGLELQFANGRRMHVTAHVHS